MAAKPNQPDFVILACLIQIWDASDSENMINEPEAPMMITEVEEIEIHDSYKNLFSTATVKFPRGTVIRKTVTEINLDDNATSVDATVEDNGLVVTTRTNTSKATVANFKVGQRIRIRMGYITDPSIAKMAKTNSTGKTIFNDKQTLSDYQQAMAPQNGSAIMFDGYIVKCSIDEPIELKCEDLASYLKKITCPKIVPTKNLTVNDLLAEDGKYKLLEKSGLKLHPKTKSCEINLGKTVIQDNLTVADVLTTWAKKARLFSFIKADGNGNPCLAVGRSYFSNLEDDSILKLKEESSVVPEILFDYHVANNGLTMMDVDKAFLAVDAMSWENIEGSKGKQYHITVRKNPEYDASKGNEKYQILNETTISKKAMKAGATVLGKSKDKVDLSTYTIIPYASSKIGISHEDLQVEAIKYFESYNANGIEGTLTIFGDLGLKSGTKVHLLDNRYPAKNGYYLIDEITTQFGVNGYRQTLKMPYCISRDKKNE